MLRLSYEVSFFSLGLKNKKTKEIKQSLLVLICPLSVCYTAVKAFCLLNVQDGGGKMLWCCSAASDTEHCSGAQGPEERRCVCKDVYISKDNVKKYALSGCCWVVHQDDNQKHASEALLVFTAKIHTFCTLLVLQQNFRTFAEYVIALARELFT